MTQFKVQGGAMLRGEIQVGGAKNHALKCIATAVVVDGPLGISRVPLIEDIRVQLEIMRGLGAHVRHDEVNGTVVIDATKITTTAISSDLAKKVRGAVVLSGALLGRFGEVTLPHPGGDVIGKRPIDIFLEGYAALGATVERRNGGFYITARNGLQGVRFVMRKSSVTATEAMVLAALYAKGTTEIVLAAMEPEVVALCDNFRSMGATIEGAGTPFLKIQGGARLKPKDIEVVPDRIETGTFAILGALAGDPIRVTRTDPTVLDALWRVLRVMGVSVEIGADWVELRRPEKLVSPFSGEVVTHEYPGFATDLQAPLMVLLSQALGQTLIHETIYEGRLGYTERLAKMGADIILLDQHRALVTGPKKLRGAHHESPDIRAGIALVLAALIAEGESTINNAYQIDRGYENIEGRLGAVGANITRE